MTVFNLVAKFVERINLCSLYSRRSSSDAMFISVSAYTAAGRHIHTINWNKKLSCHIH